MDSTKIVNGKAIFPPEANTEAYARLLDSQDPLRSFRDRFIIPTKASLKTKELKQPGMPSHFPQDHEYVLTIF